MSGHHLLVKACVILLASCALPHSILANTPDTRRLLGFDEALGQIVARSTGVATQQANVGATYSRDLPIRLSWVPTLGFNAKQTTTGVSGIDADRTV